MSKLDATRFTAFKNAGRFNDATPFVLRILFVHPRHCALLWHNGKKHDVQASFSIYEVLDWELIEYSMKVLEKGCAPCENLAGFNLFRYESFSPNMALLRRA
ncbi:MAG TPA: hypothetical protein VM821_00770 [Abditibacteriaceae bacterium]|jgi:hypothetical protein|nr:hypothetical protein [Abditibacteriaceae bacterium]